MGVSMGEEEISVCGLDLCYCCCSNDAGLPAGGFAAGAASTDAAPGAGLCLAHHTVRHGGRMGERIERNHRLPDHLC